MTILAVPLSIVALIIWDAEHAPRRAERVTSESKSSLVALASAAAAVCSAMLAGASYLASTELAEKSLVAANRPWIKVDILVGGPIVYNENGANITLQYVLKNIGRSPAVNVNVNPRIIFPIISAGISGRFDERGELMNDINARKNLLSSPFGYSLFPDDSIVQNVTVSISNDDLARATKVIGAIYPSVVGSVSYRMEFDRKVHQTGFIVRIGRADLPRPSTIAKNRSPAAIWLDEGEVPASDVRLTRSLFEGGYAD